MRVKIKIPRKLVSQLSISNWQKCASMDYLCFCHRKFMSFKEKRSVLNECIGYGASLRSLGIFGYFCSVPKGQVGGPLFVFSSYGHPTPVTTPRAGHVRTLKVNKLILTVAGEVSHHSNTTGV